MQTIQKMKDDIVSNKDCSNANGSEDEGDGSYWESNSSHAQSQWSSSVAWSTWSKMEKNKAGVLPPLEVSAAKLKKKDAA